MSLSLGLSLIKIPIRIEVEPPPPLEDPTDPPPEGFDYLQNDQGNYVFDRFSREPILVVIQ